jgi:hypothetical protein
MAAIARLSSYSTEQTAGRSSLLLQHRAGCWSLVSPLTAQRVTVAATVLLVVCLAKNDKKRRQEGGRERQEGETRERYTTVKREGGVCSHVEGVSGRFSEQWRRFIHLTCSRCSECDIGWGRIIDTPLSCRGLVMVGRVVASQSIANRRRIGKRR